MKGRKTSNTTERSGGRGGRTGRSDGTPIAGRGGGWGGRQSRGGATYSSKETYFRQLEEKEENIIPPIRRTPSRLSLDNFTIYCIYVRNHTAQGTFKDLLNDLPRIFKMKVDIIWFLPIHPIGVLQKKGTLGCPYSIRNYLEINKEYGNLEDFKKVVGACHQQGVKVMIDVVFNHTAHDSNWVEEHPQYYLRDRAGNLTRKHASWTDIVDLDFSCPALWDHLIKVLAYWVQLGVDGFRCDVATLVPLDFWKRAKQELAEINPNILWLAESYQFRSCESLRNKGQDGVSVPEMHQAFQITYDYDFFPLVRKILNDEVDIVYLLDMLRLQKVIFPQGFCKMRFVENHDTPRLIQMTKGNKSLAKAWISFYFFLKGCFLIYGGLESFDPKCPSLFDVDKVDWGSYELQEYLEKLIQIKKKVPHEDGVFMYLSASPVVTAVYYDAKEGEGIYGVFNLKGSKEKFFKVSGLVDGCYLSELDQTKIFVKNQFMKVPEATSIISFSGFGSAGSSLKFEPLPSVLFS